MKHNWTYKKLGELVDVLNGYAFKSSNYVKDGIRVIRIANVQKGKIVDEAPAFYPISAESELTRYMLYEDDILLSLTGNVGRVGLLPKEMLPAALNQRVACLRIKDDTLVFKFLYQFLNSDYFEQKCIESSRGIAQLNMSTEWLKDYPLPIPSLDEQQAIVRELDAINRLVDLQEEQLREYDRLAQSLFYTTFGDPVSNPKGWEVKKIGEVATFINGKAHEQDIDECGSFVLINSKYISSDATIFKRTNRQNEPLYKKDIVMVMSDVPNGKAIAKCLLIKEDDKYTLNQRICAFRDYEFPPLYLLFSLNRNQYYLNFDNGNSQTNLRKDDVLGCPIMCPPLSLQQTFAAQIEAIEQQKALVRRSLDETRTLLAARMQYYFNS